MFGRHQTDVLVSGAGPVGLFTALCLRDAGVECVIVDQEWRTAEHSYALALHPRTLELLDDHGLTDELLDQAYRVERVGIYEGEQRKAEFRLDKLKVKYPFLAVFRQSLLESLLQRRLERKGVKVRWNHRVNKLEPAVNDVDVTIDQLGKFTGGYASATTEWLVEKQHHFTARYVVGADGYRSAVRRAAGIDFERIADTQYFAVFEFECDEDQVNEMRMVVNPDDLNVLWPLPGGRCRWSFQLTRDVVEEETRDKNRLAVQVGRRSFPHLDQALLRDLIHQRAPWFTATIGDIVWSMAVRFEHRLAGSFGADRLWLAGDAAHLTGPVGIQSMNVGFREAQQLSGALAELVAGGGGTELLEGYDRDYRAEWRRLMGVDPVPDEAIANDWFRRNQARLLPCVPASGDQFTTLVKQLSDSEAALV